MGSGDLFAQPLGASGGLNWVFLIELLLCGILSVFFLFYFNRVFATLISYAIRAYTWHAYKAYIDITSLQISLLGGRLFFKTLRYQAQNETILIHDGRITWRYWLRRVQDADAFRTAAFNRGSPEGHSDAESSSENVTSEKPDGSRQESARIPSQTTLPCRLHVRVSGVEAFLYNHSPSYDHLMSEFEAAKAKRDSQKNTQSSSSDTGSDFVRKEKPGIGANVENKSYLDPITPTTPVVDKDKCRQAAHSLPAYLRLFPIQIECKKAAAAVGNENTRSVIVAKTQEARGRIDAAQAGPFDLFKLLFLFDAENVSISLRNNEDFKETQLAAASRSEHDEDRTKRRKRPWPSIFGPIRSLVRRVRRDLPWTRSSSASVRASSIHNDTVTSDVHDPLFTPEPWHGLARFLDAQVGAPGNEWDDVEYARLSTLAEFDNIGLKFFWDVAGPIRANVEETVDNPLLPNDANGTEPPEYGLELILGDGVVNYGPWTDRERVVLQAVFFPASLVDARPLEALKSGQTRLSTVFNMTFLVEGTITVRIPTREPSKDWKFQPGPSSADVGKNTSGLKQRPQAAHPKSKPGPKTRQDTVAKDKRSFGWMDITVSQDTIVTYNMDMYARSDGFRNALSVHMKKPRISSSVNHDILWESGDITVSGDLSNPLAWNTLRTWKFKISCDDLDLYILRDHMFLLTDVISDWTSGAVPNFYTFVPYRYELEADFNNFDLILSANDANLINRPTDLDDNNFLILKGEMLHVDFSIPLEFYRPSASTFTFDVFTQNLKLDLHNPTRLTLNELLQPKRVGALPTLTLKGSMTANAEQSPELTDVLQMEICGTELDLVVHGFLLRYFVNFKENYFGEHLHFRTFEEYQATNGDTTFAIAEEIKKYRFRRSNDLDVILSIIVERPTLKLPANLYSADNYVKIEVPIADVDLRVTNYYLDLQVDVSPASFTYVLGNERSETLPSEEQLRIESVAVTGHRLFGLPPTEPAYVSTWDIGAGRISGRCSTDFVHQLIKSGQSLAFSLEDGENALPDTEAIEVNDMIFLQVHTKELQIAMDVADAVIGIQFDPVALRFDDAADSRFSSRLSTRIPSLIVSCTTASAFNRHESHGASTADSRHLCFIETTVDLSLVSRKKGFHQQRLAQQKHVTKHDVRTGRARFLLENASENLSVHSDDLPVDNPAMPVPDLPCPADTKLNPVAAAQLKSPHHYLPSSNQGAFQPQAHAASRAPLMSAYIAPSTVNLSHLRDIPDVPEFLTQDTTDSYDDQGQDDTEQESPIEQDEAQQTLLIRLTPGVRALMRPEFLEIASQITDLFVPSKDVDLMDSLHLSVLKVVQDAAATRQGHTSIFNLQVVVPSLHLRTVVETENVSHGTRSKHQMDLTFHQLATSLRIRNVAENAGLRKVIVFHTTLENISLELFTNTASRSLSAPDIHFELEDILVWANLAEINVVDLSFKVLAMSISAYELRDTTLALIEILEKVMSMYTVVSRIDETYNIRIRQLLRFLGQKHNGGSDPLYLSRMTYVLRAFPDHLRNQESWKMLARIRHIHATLTHAQRVELETILLTPCESRQRKSSIPMQDLLSWCAWDIPAPQETAMYHYVSGEPYVVEDATQQTPLQLSLRSGVIRLQVGPSTRGSEFSIADLNIDVDVKPPSEPVGLMLVEDNLRTLVTVLSRSSAIFLRLKWDLVEAIMPILDAFELGPKAADIDEPKPTLSSLEFPVTRDDLQIFFSTDDGTVMIDTINLQHISAVRDLQLSAISTSRVAQKYANCMCLLLGADQATTELHSRGVNRQRIWRTNLSKPSIYLDVRQRLQPSVIELNIGGTYGDMVIAVEQEPIGFMTTIDRILIDEAIQISAIKDRISKLIQAPTSVTRPPSEHRRIKPIQINAALLAGAFNVNIAVLQSLVMNIRGKVANLRVKPRGHENSTLDIELDVGPIRYAALSKESGLIGEEALFHTPSAGTSIEVDLAPVGGRVKISSTIQEMLVEASAVQNIINLIRRQEVQGVLEALDSGISGLKVRISDLMGTPKVEKALENMSARPTTQYNVVVTLEGFRIVAKAPVQEAGSHSAELVFGLGMVQCAVNNGNSENTLDADFPEIFARINSIFATLDLVDNQQRTQCGHVKVGLLLRTKQSLEPSKSSIGDIFIMSDALDVEVSADTASTIVDIITHVQKKIVDLDLSKEVEYLRKLRPVQRKAVQQKVQSQLNTELTIDTITSLTPSNLVISLNHIRFAWIIRQTPTSKSDWKPEDLELSLAQVELSVKQRNRAQLKIDRLLLQMVPKSLESSSRSRNSALLPEMIFMVRFDKREEGLCLAFQAVGQALDVALDADFAGPLGLLVTSGCVALDKYREASKNWSSMSKSETKDSSPRRNPFGTTRLASLLMDLNFAGVLIHLRGKPVVISSGGTNFQLTNLSSSPDSQENAVKADFRAPGFAMKLEYLSDEKRTVEPTLTGEIKVDASSNTVYPDLVPIILQMSENAKIAMQTAEASEKHKRETSKAEKQAQRNTMISLPDENLLNSNELFARTQISIGLRIHTQEFGLSCQPFAKVNATARFDDIYMSFNTIDPASGERFVAITSSLTNLTASVQHIYSRESTFSFDMDSVSMSVMNCKNRNDELNGISAIVKVAPMKTMINARQLQDLLLFREIWLPEQIRMQQESTPKPSTTENKDDFLVERYRQVAAAAAFPWNATVSLTHIEVDIDFGQSIGKSSIQLKNSWATSTKTSGWKQELCLGIDDIKAKSVGRMGGFIELTDLRLRTLIEWPLEHLDIQRTPLIQATVGFEELRVKAAFDYQPFAFAELGKLSFIMFNVRDDESQAADRLVTTLDLGHVYAYIVASSPAQAFGLYQAFDRLIQEKQAAFKQSIADLQKQLKRPSLASQQTLQRLKPLLTTSPPKPKESEPIKLRTDVLVRIQTINVGVYPGTFFDGQLLKLEASDGQARFLVDIHDSRIHSNLGLILGQLQVALASPKRVKVPKTLGDIPIEEVIQNGAAAKGGIILRVPRLVATMQTWQPPEARVIDYIFRSTFEGKVDVGWNYSRISFIRTMWSTHTRSLAARLGKPLPESAVRITAEPDQKDKDKSKEPGENGGEQEEDQGKITAVVTMPLSRYEYKALEPPIIETPQLRDMGEATPPLEWIGLQRDKLPNVVHQVVIVTLLELAKEVEDAYGRILGSS
ncbi:hypothetical protein K461DRAFT_254355 [Myriangium duriaei CBS 260.36]|uniref:Elongation factor 2 n=1 Tax=Myriangium duriaei CBS 260.36 TaxID=1168546 RepID=A0A9P4J895_9PEZI|nr:hypothetical protein K461DRAFT_254355 [Myriangium duriaei CBS 260.36]